MPNTQKVMDYSGHSTFEFDPRNDDQVKVAMERFNDLVKNQKMMASVKTGDGERKLVREFDPAHEDVLFRPQMKGG
jgi:hypothetical protein